jgi:hypothetical protein
VSRISCAVASLIATTTLRVPMSAPLDLFVAIRIHGLAFDESGGAIPLTLQRTVSFPSPTWTTGKVDEIKWPRFHPTLASRDVPVSGYQLEARISSAEAGECGASSPRGVLGRPGRSAVVFSLDVMDVTGPSVGPRATGGNPPHTSEARTAQFIKDSLPRLCIKVAKPCYARSLAREAWFYERLDAAGLSNVVVARNYGLFHCADLSQDFKRLNMPDYDCIVERLFYKHPEGKTLLPEETGAATCIDDDFGSCKSLPWYTAREKKDKPSATVLLMEQLGNMMDHDKFKKDQYASSFA